MEEKLKHDLDEIAKTERAKIEKEVMAAHEKEHQKKIGGAVDPPKEETKKPAAPAAPAAGAGDKKKALLNALKEN